MQEATRKSFWSLGIGGVGGVAIGAGGMFISQKQATISENQYFMELDRLRHANIVDEALGFEAKLEALNTLQNVRRNGFRPVFEANLRRDIAHVKEAIARIQKAKADAAAADAEAAEKAARALELQKARNAAQALKEQAVRTNPLIQQNCGGSSGFYCP